MKYAIFEGAMTPNQNNRVQEVVEAPRTVEGVEHGLTDLYHPALVATMRRCPDDVEPGYTYDIVSDTYSAPMVAADTGNGEPPATTQDTGNGEPPPNKS